MSNTTIASPEPSLAEGIRALRRRLGLNTEQFGRIYFVSPRTVENWEQGRREPQGLALASLKKEISKLERKTRLVESASGV